MHDLVEKVADLLLGCTGHLHFFAQGHVSVDHADEHVGEIFLVQFVFSLGYLPETIVAILCPLEKIACVGYFPQDEVASLFCIVADKLFGLSIIVVQLVVDVDEILQVELFEELQLLRDIFLI